MTGSASGAIPGPASASWGNERFLAGSGASRCCPAALGPGACQAEPGAEWGGWAGSLRARRSSRDEDAEVKRTVCQRNVCEDRVLLT